MRKTKPGGTLSGWNIQRNVIRALIYRELKTRVSQVRFGAIGVFIEPIGVMAVFLTIFSFIRTEPDQGIDTALFLAAGILFFTVFNDIGVRSVNAMSANEALFFYKPVKPIDTVASRSLVECGLYSIVLIVISGAIFAIRERWLLDNIPLLVFSYLLIVLFATGLGLILMVAGHRYRALPQLVPLAMRPLWFISGVFFSLNSIPRWLGTWISWNPVLQAIEIARHAYSSNYVLSDLVSLPYLLVVALTTFTLGLAIYVKSERFLLTR